MTQSIYLLIEFLDELVFGAVSAVIPVLQQDFQLNYLQIGILLSVPGYLSIFIEPVLGILSNTWQRRRLILGGGIFFMASLLLTAASRSFELLLFSFILFYPASGAFVSLSQTALMDKQPQRREQNMARWTFAGSLGVVLGPLALGAALHIGLGWRGLHLVLAALALAALLLGIRYIHPPRINPEDQEPALSPAAFLDGLKSAITTLRRPNVLRYMLLLEFADLMLDILLAFLALYFVDVVGVSPQVAVIAVAIWTAVGLLGDFLLIPLLERVSGLAYLRFSVIVKLILFPAFLLVPGLTFKLILLGLLGLFNAGWYAILKAELYKTIPDQSGTMLVLDNLSAIIGKSLPLAIASLAYFFGLQAAMWAFLAGPLALLIGLPRKNRHA
jgi:FSR family fosmidomycin resistance protein-like MFS transporter